jgi:hypothetical protein
MHSPRPSGELFRAPANDRGSGILLLVTALLPFEVA